MVKLFSRKRFMLLMAVIFCVVGCIPGITVSKKDAKIDSLPLIEYRLGTDVEMAEWVELRRKVCEDLDYATEGLPKDVRQDIFKYSCIENNRQALGKALEKLQKGQIDKICSRLSDKGYIAKSDKIPTAAESLAAALAVFVIILL